MLLVVALYALLLANNIAPCDAVCGPAIIKNSIVKSAPNAFVIFVPVTVPAVAPLNAVALPLNGVT